MSTLSTDESLASFRPRTGSTEAWNAAYVRAEEYLRAHRIHNRLHQGRLIQRCLERAARRHEANPALDPTTLAIEEMEGMMLGWFEGMLGRASEAAERTPIDGRVALLLADGPQRWPYAFLSTEPAPDAFREAMRASLVRAGPDMNVSSMVPRPIDLGPLSDAAGETIDRIGKWPVLRTLLLWLVFIASLAAIFHFTR